jgi:uncharacterized UBP type Zn finger protein
LKKGVFDKGRRLPNAPPEQSRALSTTSPAVTRLESEEDMPVCAHLDQIRKVTPSADGCEDCLKIGATWVHLRLCLTCGHVGCCDSSPNRHATKHFGKAKHPIVQSFEPGEDWRWCYIDEAEV